MSRRLQVRLDESEFRQIQRIAKRHHVTAGEWVRQTLRAARRAEPSRGRNKKLNAVRAAYRHSLPAGEIEEMLSQTERGYSAAGAGFDSVFPPKA